MSLNRNDFDQSLKNGFPRGSGPVWKKKDICKKHLFQAHFPMEKCITKAYRICKWIVLFSLILIEERNIFALILN